ncbi:hypothetical protein E5673_14700 [Sphingomonas sp. PAMC26645]|uniref:hypothetical protein n=1 Tax=Sphingomonas sp. PAMC26645 TaxID=2565555 RepID=UPI00109DA96C|nr:hypothetical protein [Sphingomonas sp. PAMC26645]QCB43320.1 hypothetical protein E5673_14700 [Sphingomonas sp. PAMC26645]
MRYPKIRYQPTNHPAELNLHSFDGTFRSVGFKSENEALSAMIKGRAEADCVAIEHGLLPRGALVVSRPSARDAKAVLRETLPDDSPEDAITPLAIVRLRFSQSRLVDRGCDITDETDACVRSGNPEDARRYDRLLTVLEKAHRDGSLC